MAKKRKKKIAARKRVKAKAKRRPIRRKRVKKAKGSAVSRAFHTVIDTVTGTDKLRNKLEPPATSETE